MFAANDCLEVNLGEKRVAIEFFLGFSLEIDVGVAGEAAKDDGVSIVVTAESGVSGASNDALDDCLSFFSREYTGSPDAKNASKFFCRKLSWVKVGLETRIFKSSRKRDAGGSICSLDDGRPNFPNEILLILDFSLLVFFVPLLSKVLVALLKVSSALNKFSSTTLDLDLFIKSSANETFGLGSRFADVREVIDERNWLGDEEFCLDREFWFE